MAEELKTLEFSTSEDLEVPVPEKIKVPLGGEEFIARCPNEWEFVKIAEKARAIENGEGFDVYSILLAFFDRTQAKRIDNLMSGSEPAISLIGQLKPALFALLEHYEPQVMKRMEKMGQKVDPPRGQKKR